MTSALQLTDHQREEAQRVAVVIDDAGRFLRVDPLATVDNYGGADQEIAMMLSLTECLHAAVGIPLPLTTGDPEVNDGIAVAIGSLSNAVTTMANTSDREAFAVEVWNQYKRENIGAARAAVEQRLGLDF